MEVEPPLQAPPIIERRRKRWTLRKSLITIVWVEFIFYSLVIALFAIGLTHYEYLPKLLGNKTINVIIRSTVIGFAATYVILAFILLIAVIHSFKSLLRFWILATLVLMGLEWICALVCVALLLNSSLFFISGSYGPIRLLFVCLAQLYLPRLKGKSSTTMVPIVRANDNADGYSVVHNAIFPNPNDSPDDDDRGGQSLKVTIEIQEGNDDLSVI